MSARPQTLEQAHAAGHRDGKAGVGALPPRTGPRGTLARKLHDAYMQSYRDALVARVGVSDPRTRNRRPSKRKRPRVVTTTTRSNIKTIRRTANRRPALVVLVAVKPGMRRLRYVGHGKFGERARPVLFGSVAEANAVGRVLRDAFPQALRGWTLSASAGTEAPAAPAERRRRRLSPGVDPAEKLFRDQARRDSEAAHRWLSRQAK